MAPASDPILRAVAAATVNVPVSVVSAAGTPVSLIVTADYNSAAGEECRAYTLGGGQDLACTDGKAWRQIPPLAPAANTGPTQ